MMEKIYSYGYFCLTWYFVTDILRDLMYCCKISHVTLALKVQYVLLITNGEPLGPSMPLQKAQEFITYGMLHYIFKIHVRFI